MSRDHVAAAIYEVGSDEGGISLKVESRAWKETLSIFRKTDVLKNISGSSKIKFFYPTDLYSMWGYGRSVSFSLDPSDTKWVAIRYTMNSSNGDAENGFRAMMTFSAIAEALNFVAVREGYQSPLPTPQLMKLVMRCNPDKEGYHISARLAPEVRRWVVGRLEGSPNVRIPFLLPGQRSYGSVTLHAPSWVKIEIPSSFSQLHPEEQIEPPDGFGFTLVPRNVSSPQSQALLYAGLAHLSKLVNKELLIRLE